MANKGEDISTKKEIITPVQTKQLNVACDMRLYDGAGEFCLSCWRARKVPVSADYRDCSCFK
ncbi:hypothetical protein O9993_23150 [Vibrio lentus]|nr:hypothetical protein [Vibrio lentus]